MKQMPKFNLWAMLGAAGGAYLTINALRYFFAVE